MKSWQVLKQAIPDGKVDEVAERMGVSADTVRRWRREPLSDDAPTESGRKSPLDRMNQLVDSVFLVNPGGSHTVAENPREHYKSLAETHALKGTVKGAAAVALADMVQAVNAINLDAPVGEIETKIAAVEAQLEEMKRHVRVTYANRNGDKVTVMGAGDRRREAGMGG
jgi:transposase-like protein